MLLALYTFGQFIEPADSTANDGFHARNDPILQMVDQAAGLVARSGYASDPGPEPWGQEVYPEFYTERGDGWSPATLSLWEDMESLFVFTYFGLHDEALKHGHEWFQKPHWPPLVLWWQGAETRPTWAQGVERHRHLHENGPAPFAFTFKHPFDKDGNATKLDKARVQNLHTASA
ncbi:MAG: DUF3291 domain-containing protein [Alphaproteobacteria bacterium]|nr:DUF3291 domain-containing protein [Alphaproteobacteria bacterium]